MFIMGLIAKDCRGHLLVNRLTAAVNLAFPAFFSSKRQKIIGIMVIDLLDYRGMERFCEYKY